MGIDEVHKVLSRIHYPDYEFSVEQRGEVMLMKATYVEEDIQTGSVATQTTRKWYISPHAALSEIVQTAFLCILTSAEHRVREHFKFDGGRPYGPHFNAETLAELSKRKEALDYRGKE